MTNKSKKNTQKRKTAGSVVDQTNLLGQPLTDENGVVKKCISGEDDRWGASLGLRKELPNCSIFNGGKKKTKRKTYSHKKRRRTGGSSKCTIS